MGDGGVLPDVLPKIAREWLGEFEPLASPSTSTAALDPRISRGGKGNEKEGRGSRQLEAAAHAAR